MHVSELHLTLSQLDTSLVFSVNIMLIIQYKAKCIKKLLSMLVEIFIHHTVNPPKNAVALFLKNFDFGALVTKLNEKLQI